VKRRGLWAFFIVPYAGTLLLFFAVSTLNRGQIRSRTEGLVHEQLLATARILALGMRDALDTGIRPADLLDRYGGGENIYFMALLDAREEVMDWVSRFEGYLPLARRSIRHGETWTIDSPAGPILNIIAALPAGKGPAYHLYLGYSLTPLREMERRGRINFLLLFGALALAGLIVFRGVYSLHRHALAKAEEALAEQKEKERFKVVSGLTAGVAHEIKNPLNSLGLLLDLLKDKSPEVLRPDIDLGLGEVRRIARIVDIFAEGLKPLVPRLVPVRLPDVLEDVRNDLAAEARGRETEIVLNLRDVPPFPGDPDLLRQALANLIRNGLEASPGGRVEVTAARTGGGVRICVADDGPGVPEADRDRIFQPFTSTKAAGMGVGLFLVRKIIEAHGGTIRLENAATGRLAAFVLELPGGAA
jgi:signal transduction histidine kinase